MTYTFLLKWMWRMKWRHYEKWIWWKWWKWHFKIEINECHDNGQVDTKMTKSWQWWINDIKMRPYDQNEWNNKSELKCKKNIKEIWIK